MLLDDSSSLRVRLVASSKPSNSNSSTWINFYTKYCLAIQIRCGGIVAAGAFGYNDYSGLSQLRYPARY
jgi:hypothetical protein